MGKRRSSGGTIIHRADGRWEARVSIGDGAGRRRRKSFYGRTQREVHQRLTQALHDQQQGLPVGGDERQALGTYLEAWLRTTQPTIRPTTFVSYTGHVRRHLIPALGRIPLVKVTPQQVRALLADKSAEGLAPGTVQRIHATLRACLNQAFRDGLVARNVAMLVSPPRAVRYDMKPLDPDGARRLLAAAKGDRLEALYAVGLAMGLRQGEALGLCWSDVDWEAGTLQVRHSLQRVPKMLREDHSRGADNYRLVEPKTRQRTILMPQVVATALHDHRLRQLEERLAAGPAWGWKGGDLVFATTVGTPLDATVVTKGFQALLARSGLPRIRFHDLRHSAATLLLAQGVIPRVLMETLGHTQIGTTLNLYAHVLPTLQRDATDRMDALLTAEA